MTDRFLQGMKSVFLHEGGYSNNPNDAGMATNYGISLTFLEGMGLKHGDLNHDGKIDGKDIRQLTKEQAEKLYWVNFWNPIYDELQERVGIKVFDMAVNAGDNRAHKILQKALNNLGESLVVDGVAGNGTVTACLKHDEQDVLDAYSKEQADFYRALVIKRPANKEFLSGWLHRAAWQPK